MNQRFGLIVAASLLLFSSCGKKEAEQTQTEAPAEQVAAFMNVESAEFYGDSIALDAPTPIDSVVKTAMSTGQKTDNMRVSGVIESSCATKGCWVRVKLENGETVHTMFKDYGFFVPTNRDLKGKKIVMEGFAFTDTTSVDDLKHFAHDEGKPEAEIAKITEPKVAVSFEASGVAVEK